MSVARILRSDAKGVEIRRCVRSWSTSRPPPFNWNSQNALTPLHPGVHRCPLGTAPHEDPGPSISAYLPVDAVALSAVSASHLRTFHDANLRCLVSKLHLAHGPAWPLQIRHFLKSFQCGGNGGRGVLHLPQSGYYPAPRLTSKCQRKSRLVRLLSQCRLFHARPGGTKVAWGGIRPGR